MHRLLVALLSAFDAVVAAAAGVSVAVAPLTLLWVFGLDGGADWRALWPASAAVWQLGNLAPLHITLPADYLVAAGIPSDAASFTLSLAPLAFAAFTAIFAARSGTRAAGAQAWITGVLTGTAAYAALAAVIALTSRNEIAQPRLWQAVVFPAALFGSAALLGALVAAWRKGDAGLVDRLHARALRLSAGWALVPGLTVRAAAICLTALIGLGAALTGLGFVLRGDEVIALYERAHVDALGAVILTLAQLAYLPTLIVWAISWIAGPGFAVGTGTAVSPSGTQLGVVPGIPALGILPETISPWLLLVILLPIAAGAFAGWVARSRFVAAVIGPVARAEPTSVRVPGAPAALPAPAAPAPTAPVAVATDLPGRHEPVAPRLVIAVLAAVLTAAGAALLALAASGSLGPGHLAEVGPDPGPVALAIGLEVLLGASILLLSPRGRTDVRGARRPPSAAATSEDRSDVGGFGAYPPTSVRSSDAGAALVEPQSTSVEPTAPRAAAPDGPPPPALPDPPPPPDPSPAPDPSTLGHSRPAPLPPVD